MSYETVTDYRKSLSESGEKALDEFVTFMSTTFPSLKVHICFSMPMWFFHDKMKDGYIGISCAKTHFSIHFSNEAFVEELALIYKQLKYGKRCVNIKYDDVEGKKAIFEKVKEAVDKFF